MSCEKHTAQENYPQYDALWHLVSMGVLTGGHEPNGWSAPACGAKKTRVAMIDTSVAVKHPNLKGVIESDLAFDLFSTRLGAFPYRKPNCANDPLVNKDTAVTYDLKRSSELLAELIDRLSPVSELLIDTIQPAVLEAFSGHGTAIAGLIGAQPVEETLKFTDIDGTPGERKVPLPFCGVDPNCEIVPISTNFDTDPEELILAFLYAELIGADVIVLPRVIPDVTRSAPELNQHTVLGIPLDRLVSPEAIDRERLELWGELAQLILNISQRRAIVCAAGNENEEQGIYPANLVAEDNGIISVGAVNGKGALAGYSDSAGVTVCAPSGDGEVFNEWEVRLDEQNSEYRPEGIPEGNFNHAYSSLDVISTDVPGGPGYSGGPFLGDEPEEGIREYGSYYCRFGGTSASSALVAGFIALGMSAPEEDGISQGADGITVKDWLIGKSQTLSYRDREFLFPVWKDEPGFPEKL